MDLAHSQRLWSALGPIADRIRVAQEPREVWTILGAELRKLGCSCLVARWDPATKGFRREHVSLVEPKTAGDMACPEGPPWWQEPLLTAETIPEIFAALVGRQEPLFQAGNGASPPPSGIHPLSAPVQILALPLTSQGRLVGMLAIWGTDLGPEVQGPARVLASQIAGVLGVDQLHREMERRCALERQVLTGLGPRLLAQREREAVLATTLDTLAALVRARGAGFWTPGETGEGSPEVVWGTWAEVGPPSSLQPLLDRAADQARVVVCPATGEAEPGWTWVAVPVPGHETGSGVLALEVPAGEVDQGMEDVLLLVAGLTAQALEAVDRIAVFRASEARYRRLFEDVPVGLFITTPDDRVLDLNPALLRIFGVPDRDLGLTLRPSQFWANPEDRLEWLREVAGKAEVHSVELRMRRYDGREIWVHGDARAVTDPEGQVLYYTGSITDITERRQWEEAEAARRARLERQQRAIHELAMDPAAAEGRLEEAFSSIVTQVAQTLEVARANIWLLDADQQMRCVASYGCPEEIGQTLALGENSRYMAALVQEHVVVVEDVRNDPRTAELSQDYWIPLGIASSIDVPLRRGGQVIGALCIEHVGQQRAWEPDEVTFAARSGEVVLRALLHGELRRRVEALEHLVHLSAELRQVRRVQEMIPVLLEATARISGGERGTIYLQDPQSGDLVLRGWYPDTFSMPSIRMKPGEGITGSAFLEGTIQYTQDIRQDPRLRLFPGQEAFLAGIRTAVTLPLRFQDRVIGVMHVAYSDVRLPDPETQRLLEAVAEIAGHALQRAVLLETLEQQVAERTQKLVESLERTAAILTGVGDAVIVLDTRGRVQQVNPAFVEQTGFRESQVVGIHYRDMMPWVAARGRVRELVERLQQGESWRGELEVRRRNGERFDVSLVAGPIQGRDGTILGYVVTIRDITPQKELERMKDRFIQDMSHELRTPLSNIRLYLDLLERSDDPANRTRYLAMLRQQNQLLTDLVESILELSRLEAQIFQGARATQDLNAVVQEVVAEAQERARRKGLALETALTPGLPPVWATATELRQVVVNLVSNAIRYTERGWVRVRTGRSGRWVELEVQDTGIGIHPEDMPHLFERFYRGRGASQSAISGTGLGLGIVKAVLEELRGQIQVESQVDRGSLFRVRLPACE